MMRTRHADRLWAIGGALSAAVLIAVGWSFFIGPQKAETSSLHDEAAATQSHATILQGRLAQLRKQNSDLALYQRELKRDQQALPPVAELSAFLRQLQMASASSGVSVTGITVSGPRQVTAGGPAFALPVVLTAEGTGARLNRFVHHLQQIQPRAVLINGANATAKDARGSLADAVSLTLNTEVFVAPSGDAGPAAPAVPPN